MSKDYYYFHWKKEDGGIAVSPEDNEVDFVKQLEHFDKVPFEFTMEDGSAEDYLANDLGWPIFSQRFKELMEPYLSQINHKWIPAVVNDGKGNKEIFYVLKFNNKFDILDKEKTIFVDDDSYNDIIVKAVLSKDKVKNKDIFIIPDSDFQIVVSEDVKSKIEENNLTGINFSKVPVA